MYIGSGDIKSLMSGKSTQAHLSLLRRFVSDVKPFYNAKASPIDACRIGAILEDRYLLILPDDYYAQWVSVSKEMDVFKCSIDFAKIECGKIIDFDELKTVYLTDFFKFQDCKGDNSLLLEYVKKKYKSYYYQVQEQLFCSSLNACNLVFLSVTSYDDDENNIRDIQENEYLKIRVSRDEKVINEIKERGLIFQQIKNCYT